MKYLWIALGIVSISCGIVALPRESGAADYTVYSVYKALDLGNPGEAPEKDYYVNMGKQQGVHDGSILEVQRKISTYDLLSEKLYKEVTFPIAHLKVIHAEGSASIARMDKMMPADKTPAITPRAVMVGDLVQVAQ